MNKYLKDGATFIRFKLVIQGQPVAAVSGPERDIRRVKTHKALLLMHRSQEGYLQVF